MRRYLTGLMTAVFAFILALPLPVRAGEQETVYLEAEEDSVKVRLALPGADGSMLSSLKLTLNVASDSGEVSDASFEFDAALSGKTKVREARYRAEDGTLNVYIAGREALFAKGEETITLGKVRASCGAFTVEVKEDALTVAEGSVGRTVKFEKLPQAALAGGASLPGDGGGEATPPSDPGTDGTIVLPKEEEQLQQSVNEAKKYPKNGYTAKSYAALEEARKNAEGVLGNPNATKEEKDDALQSLQNAVGALEENSLTSAEEKNGQNESRQGEGDVKGSAPIVLYVMIGLFVLVIAGITIYGVRYKKRVNI